VGEPAAVLAVTGVSVRFDGVVALDDITVRVDQGEIVGLLGPNGAGKTTLLDSVSGHTRGTGGRVALLGTDVTGFSPARRARLGMGRGYQDGRLFPALSVLENVQLAAATPRDAGVIAALVGAPWARFADRQARARAESAVAQFGLQDYAATPAAQLSTGLRRICDLAVQTAAGVRLLLLDEPAAGIAQREAEALGPILKRFRDESGCSILIVEHDMSLLMSVADRLYALDSGRVIAEGSPAQLRRNPAVVASYLGTQRARRAPRKTKPRSTVAP